MLTNLINNNVKISKTIQLSSKICVFFDAKISNCTFWFTFLQNYVPTIFAIFKKWTNYKHKTNKNKKSVILEFCVLLLPLAYVEACNIY